MKIAIKANPSRGKEIISLLENLGGINSKNWKGDGEIYTYYIDKNNKIQYDRAPADYKVYTLEEFEKLTTYKEMKAERIIALTLEKAKEWYKKGGELREIALQAFTEKELNPLPRSWEEFCKQCNPVASWRYVIPTKYEALFKLEQLRDCWRQGNTPQEGKYKIRKVRNKYTIVYGVEGTFLSFCDNQTAKEFLECFRGLIEQAGDLI